MSISRAKKYLVSLLAVMSLFVSAASACACSHHIEPKKTELSCHSSSHEMPAETPASEPSDAFDSGCNCLVRTPVPAIVAKTDDKRSGIEKQIVELEFALPQFIEREVIPFESEQTYTGTSTLYKQDLLSSLPSRAPPRL